MIVVHTEVLSSTAPCPAGADRSPGVCYAVYTPGDELIVCKNRRGKYYYFFAGVSASGFAYETEDHGPFETALAAMLDAAVWYTRGDF